ncbi:MAG TPA: DNA gyrase inhibitor YacG [Sphingorhabdus sp.]|nr:DNA gyrase inhibitor YacG [Sphingorhabdus sp.]
MSRKADLCPLCKQPANMQHKPFCSQGCKDRDLIKWLDEGYRVAGPPAEYEDSFGGGERD